MADHGIDVHEELANAKVSGFHVRLGLIMGLLTLFDGYDTFNPAYVIHYVAGPWGLQGSQAGLLISSGLIDSFSLVDLALYVEDQFGVHLDDSELNANTFDTLGQLESLIQQRQA